MLLALLVIQPLFAQVPSYVPTNGLVGYWPFNGNANDESGNGYNGTVVGPSLSSDRLGISNSAYSFDGINDFISCLPIPISGTAPRSVNFWYKETGTITTGNTAFSWGASTQGNRFDCGVSFGVSVGAAYSAKLFSFNAASTNWNMYTIILPSITNPTVNDILVYQNGVLLTNVITNSSINIFQSINTTANQALLFGRNNNTGNQAHLLGQLDDFGIWNRALTPQEITNLYNSVNANECLTMVINSGPLSTNPVTYASTVNIFPNPANDQITIDCGNLANVVGWNIKITNALGQQVFAAPMNTQQYVVPLNSWSGQGMYFVKILNAQNEVVNIKKIILQ